MRRRACEWSFLILLLVGACGDTFGAEGSTCSDGMKNGDEAGVDCGGSCVDRACTPPSCNFAACPCANYVNNPSEIPGCEAYLVCYQQQQCLPDQPCREPDGLCGVNTIGGGAGPQLAAVAVWDCACP